MKSVIVTLEFDGDDDAVEALIAAAKEFSGGGKEYFEGGDDLRDAAHIAVEEALRPRRRRGAALMIAELYLMSTGQTTGHSEEQ